MTVDRRDDSGPVTAWQTCSDLEMDVASKAMTSVCAHCGREFVLHPAARGQQYCGEPECTKARKRAWQRAKLKSDADYKENQASAQREWQSTHPDYWREYRARSPNYTRRNRQKQRRRNRRRGCVIAKMDALQAQSKLLSEQRRLIDAGEEMIAKMDALEAHAKRVPGLEERVRFEKQVIAKMDVLAAQLERVFAMTSGGDQ